MTAIDIVPILLIFGVMYFLIVRPQVREKQEHDKLLASLAKGDRVITASGIHGTVSAVDTDTVVLEVAEKTRITIEKSSVARRVNEPSKEAAAPKAG